jgi:phosphoribosyl 1,2-cyclic phosphodiesterase
VRVRFWGVRGSVPFATPRSIGLGCNTACIEVRDDRTGALLVLDAGSGIVGFGESLKKRGGPMPILLTHYHWDHIQGLPFFAPFYQPGWQPTIFSPIVGNVDQAFVETIFQTPFFPVPFMNLISRPEVTLLPPRDFELGGFAIRAQPLTHPGGAFAYRIRGDRGDLVYATDHEFGDPGVDAALAAFCAGAAAVILDAHFTPDELPAHKGWGHGTWRQCADFAAASRVGQLWLFHHKPGRTDEEMAQITARARHVFAGTAAASEGTSFEV